MRTRTGLFLLAVCCLSLAQQVGQDYKAFEALAQAKLQEASAAYTAKNYAKATELAQEIEHAYDVLPAEGKKREIGTAAVVDYSLACFACLGGDQVKALACLNTAVDLGFVDYKQMKSDHDLDALRSRREFKSLLARVRSIGDFEFVLKSCGPYTTEADVKPTFEYENPADARLTLIRQKYNLDMVAGTGDDVSKVMRLMRWVHLTINHDGRNWPSVPQNADDLIAYASKEHKGINCRCMSITLNDCYLAMGLRSHVVTCLPKNPNDKDCHVINVVYVPSLKKWVWMDASFCGYFKDEKGILLGIEEVRERVIHGKPVVASSELEWNGEPYPVVNYRDYMTKNMYWFSIALKSETDYETAGVGKKMSFVHLLPKGFEPDKTQGWPRTDSSVTNLFTSDPHYFWQGPSKP